MNGNDLLFERICVKLGAGSELREISASEGLNIGYHLIGYIK